MQHRLEPVLGRAASLHSLRELPCGRKPERNGIFRIAALNVRGLSLPDQIRVVVRRHLIGCSYLFIARW